MRTTIRLKGELLELAKHRAAESGRSLTAFIEDAVVREIARPKTFPPVVIPLSTATGGLLPGIDPIKLRRLDEDEDVERYAKYFEKP